MGDAAFQKGDTPSLSVKLYTLSDDNVKILGKLTHNRGIPSELTEEDLNDMLQLCNIDYGTYSCVTHCVPS